MLGRGHAEPLRGWEEVAQYRLLVWRGDTRGAMRQLPGEPTDPRMSAQVWAQTACLVLTIDPKQLISCAQGGEPAAPRAVQRSVGPGSVSVSG